MYCAYHPTSAARVQCASCARSLCVACDHRIKGYPYCQDCIVLGIESLSGSYQKRSNSKSKARLAALCALLPGMGAVYNRQNIKAVVHFITIVGLFSLSDLHMVEGFFVLSGMAFYFYSIMDAYRTARLVAEGESAEADEERFKRSLTKRAPVIGMVLIVTGILFVAQSMLGFSLTFSRLLPVGLIILGGYLLTRYFKRSSEDYYTDYSRRPSAPLIPGRFGDSGRSDSRHASQHGGYR